MYSRGISNSRNYIAYNIFLFLKDFDLLVKRYIDFFATTRTSSWNPRFVSPIRIFEKYPSFFCFQTRWQYGRENYFAYHLGPKIDPWRKAREHKGLNKSPRMLFHPRYSLRDLSRGSTSLSRRCGIGRINVAAVRARFPGYFEKLLMARAIVTMFAIKFVLMSAHTRKKKKRNDAPCLLAIYRFGV